MYSKEKYHTLVRTQDAKQRERRTVGGDATTGTVTPATLKKTATKKNTTTPGGAASTRRPLPQQLEGGVENLDAGHGEEGLPSLRGDAPASFIDPTAAKQLMLDPLPILHIAAKDLKSITEVNFSNKNITRIHPNFMLLENCQLLILQHNALTEIKGLLPPVRTGDSGAPAGFAGSVKGCGRLRQLFLSHNHITTLEGSDLPRLTALQELYLDGNQLRHLPRLLPVLRRLRELEVLDLRGNPAAEEPHYRTYVIQQLPQLQRLDRMAITREEREAAKVFVPTEADTDGGKGAASLRATTNTAVAAPGGPSASSVAFGTTYNTAAATSASQANSQALWGKSATVKMLEKRKDAYVRSQQQQQEAAEKAVQDKVDALVRERDAFHAIWDMAGNQVNKPAAAAATPPEQTRLSRGTRSPVPPPSLPADAAAKEKAAAETQSQSALYAALAGRDDMVAVKTAALPWAAAALPPPDRLAEIQRTTGAAAQLLLNGDSDSDREEGAAAALRQQIVSGRAAIIPRPWEGAQSEDQLQLGALELQDHLLHLLRALLLPEEVRALEGAYGAAEVLQVLALPPPGAESAPTSKGGRPGSGKRVKGSASASRAAEAEKLLDHAQLLNLATSPLWLKGSVSPGGAYHGFHLEADDAATTTASGGGGTGGGGANASTTGGTVVGVIGPYTNATWQSFLASLRPETGAWDIEAAAVLRASLAAHQIDPRVYTVAAAPTIGGGTSSKNSSAGNNRRGHNKGSTTAKSVKPAASVANANSHQNSFEDGGGGVGTLGEDDNNNNSNSKDREKVPANKQRRQNNSTSIGAATVAFFEQESNRDYEAATRKSLKSKNNSINTTTTTVAGGREDRNPRSAASVLSMISSRAPVDDNNMSINSNFNNSNNNNNNAAGGSGGASNAGPSGSKKPYLSVNNALGLLAFYIPFVEARYNFFRAKSTEAIAKLQGAQGGPASAGASRNTSTSAPTSGKGSTAAASSGAAGAHKSSSAAATAAAATSATTAAPPGGGGGASPLPAATPGPKSEAMVWFSRAQEVKQHLDKLRSAFAVLQKEHRTHRMENHENDNHTILLHTIFDTSETNHHEAEELSEKDVIIPSTALDHFTVRPAGSYFKEKKDAPQQQ